jgi:hypothetical protein
MEFEKKKNEHGWRWIITDDLTEERFVGNIAPTISVAKQNCIRAFINQKRQRIKKIAKEIPLQEKSIDKLTSLLL